MEHLQASIQAFYRRHGCFPAQLLVSPKDVERTRDRFGRWTCPVYREGQRAAA